MCFSVKQQSSLKLIDKPEYLCAVVTMSIGRRYNFRILYLSNEPESIIPILLGLWLVILVTEVYALPALVPCSLAVRQST